MYITKKKYEEICKKYSTLLFLDSDPEQALNFVHDVLEAEADALKEHEPQATKSIHRLDAAAYEVFDISQAINNEDFREG